MEDRTKYCKMTDEFYSSSSNNGFFDDFCNSGGGGVGGKSSDAKKNFSNASNNNNRKKNTNHHHQRRKQNNKKSKSPKRRNNNKSPVNHHRNRSNNNNNSASANNANSTTKTNNSSIMMTVVVNRVELLDGALAALRDTVEQSKKSPSPSMKSLKMVSPPPGLALNTNITPTAGIVRDNNNFHQNHQNLPMMVPPPHLLYNQQLLPPPSPFPNHMPFPPPFNQHPSQQHQLQFQLQQQQQQQRHFNNNGFPLPHHIPVPFPPPPQFQNHPYPANNQANPLMYPPPPPPGVFLNNNLNMMGNNNNNNMPLPFPPQAFPQNNNIVINANNNNNNTTPTSNPRPTNEDEDDNTNNDQDSFFDDFNTLSIEDDPPSQDQTITSTNNNNKYPEFEPFWYCYNDQQEQQHNNNNSDDFFDTNLTTNNKNKSKSSSSNSIQVVKLPLSDYAKKTQRWKYIAAKASLDSDSFASPTPTATNNNTDTATNNPACKGDLSSETSSTQQQQQQQLDHHQQSSSYQEMYNSILNSPAFIERKLKPNPFSKKNSNNNNNSSIFCHDKYWAQRHRLFSKFDLGIQLDTEGWYSVSPEVIADHVAQRIIGNFFCSGTPKNNNDVSERSISSSSSNGVVILDAFGGMGGNSIAFAKLLMKQSIQQQQHQYGRTLTAPTAKVVCIDTDINKLKMAANNAFIYQIHPDNIVFIQANSIYVMDQCYHNGVCCYNHESKRRSNDGHHDIETQFFCGYSIGGLDLLPPFIDAIFMDPPWGGVDYGSCGKNGFDLQNHIQFEYSNTNNVVDNSHLRIIDGFDLLKIASDALGGIGEEGKSNKNDQKIKKFVIYDLPRNTNKTSLGEASLHAGFRGNFLLEEHFLNGRLKTITAYLGVDSRELLSLASETS